MIKKLENGDGLDAESLSNPFQAAPEAIRQKFDDLFGKVRERMAGMRKNDVAPELMSFTANEAGLLTVEEMIARIQGEGEAAGPQQGKAKEMGVAC